MWILYLLYHCYIFVNMNYCLVLLMLNIVILLQYLNFMALSQYNIHCLITCLWICHMYLVPLDTRFIGFYYSYNVTLFIGWEFFCTFAMILVKTVLYDINMFLICAGFHAADLFFWRFTSWKSDITLIFGWTVLCAFILVICLAAGNVLSWFTFYGYLDV